ncbi:hypothetical protein [Morganella morganii IS15]|nr:hypothetical protein CSB69_2327 [Morganella morganii]EMP50483.1 hypothetical protein C790_02363 [Morganella morganii SC01]CDK64832.1 hypothetical protein [Morganella morganii IS15]
MLSSLLSVLFVIISNTTMASRFIRKKVNVNFMIYRPDPL